MVNPYHRTMSLMVSIALWNLVTRLGEAQILLPAALMTAMWFVWRDRSPRLAAVWLGGIVIATLVTTASKVAFMGYGLGWAALDFTGVSGHSMFAAAIYPLTGVAISSAVAGLQAPRWWRLGLAAGVALALLVGLSRVAVEAHSWSEVTVGLLVGGAVTLVAARAERSPPARHSLWLPVLVCVWLGSALPNAPPSPTHGWVTRLALTLSGRSEPYTRADMLAPHTAPADSER
jgi:membrane-associated phospholipid phosphatase